MEVIYNKEKDMLIYDRKLKDGPGNSMYGLEVCKSLSLPQHFLDAAYEIRMKYHPETSSILSLKTSRYNSKKIVGMCEKCGIRPGKEVHHMQYQKDANNSNGLIINCDGIMHKNHVANLLTICEECHNEIHRNNTKLKKVKTTKGTNLQEI
jgi:DNA mismatch repair protein MutS